MKNLLEIQNLKVEFSLERHTVAAVEDVSLYVKEKETVVLAGESGSGKTVTALYIARILPPNARIISGSINYEGSDILKMGEPELLKIRGSKISYIFQEPVAYLNPVYNIGNQISEVIRLHQNKTAREAWQQAIGLLEMVKIDDPGRVVYNYPHQLSGGMNQRVFLAMALACQPKLLIADEPTTSLDVTIEAQILALLKELQQRLGFSLILITHNLSVAKKIGDRIYVMYKGKIVDEGRLEELFRSPKHFHTRELIQAYEKIGKLG